MSAPDYSKSPYEINQYFNLENGEVLVGECAALRAARISEFPDSIRDLGELLLDQTLEIHPDQYERLNVEDWNLRQYIRYGTWIHRLVTPPDEVFTNLSETTLERSARLGLGPSVKRITASGRFGSYSNFYREIGTAERQSKGRYDHWPHGRFADHVVKAFLTRPNGMSTSDYLVELAQANEGPGLAPLDTELLDERGYPDIRSWDKDTYKDWGSTVMAANNGKRIKRKYVRYLSGRHRGPSPWAVNDKFDLLSTFQEQSAKRYEKLAEELEERRCTRTSQLVNRRSRPGTLIGLVRADHVPDWLAVRMSAQYMLLDAALPPKISTPQKELLATKGQRGFSNGTSLLIGEVQLPRLRNLAEEMDIHTDIWPRHNPEHLKVPEFVKS